jgi:regulator of replication initiation timing
MNLLKKVFCSECINTIDRLTLENQDLKLRLVEKQEHINQTNAYYKKKMHEMKKTTKPKKEKPSL